MITVPMNVTATAVSVPMGVNAGEQEVPVGMGASYELVEATNYEQLTNKPQINGVELIGNKLLEDLFPDGIIIDGGGA